MLLQDIAEKRTSYDNEGVEDIFIFKIRKIDH